ALFPRVAVFQPGMLLTTSRAACSHPATQSHRGLDSEVRLAQGIPDGLVRLSIGLESVEDILQDLDRAIELSGV
ncbi:MAG: PLP-dependent transferase, partial [Bacteroidota bacterium]